MGIAPILVERIYETIAEINKQGMTILLVEQNANFALDVSKRGYVLETGTVVHDRRVGGAADQPRSAEGLPRTHDTSSRSSAPRRCGCSTSWLLAAIVASYLSERKGYGEKPGLATGLLLHADRRDHLALLAGEAGLEVEDDRRVRPRQGRPGGDVSARRRGGAGPRLRPRRNAAACSPSRGRARMRAAPSARLSCDPVTTRTA